jgi:hypothetical protein
MAHRTVLSTLLSALALSLLFLVTGCDFDGTYAGGSSPPATETSSLDPDAFYTASVGGSVGDGPIVGATIKVFARSGELLPTTTLSDNTADYSFSIRTQGRNYPLTIVADGGTDIVTNREPDFKLVTTVMKPGNGQTANLNPYSTLIVLAAQHAGGITEENIAKATEAVVSRYGFGLNPALLPDPLFTLMDESNVHLIVKASETMGEMIRRVRNAMTAAGTYVDGNDVVRALGADLVDGWIDGRGADGYDRRIAAVANVASSAVMVEAMANRLHVYDVDAARYMDDAIRQVRPNAPASINTRNVSIPTEALDQSLRSLRAAKVVKNDSRITEIYERVAGAKPGTTEFNALSSDGIQTMSSKFHNPLNGAVLATAFISEQTKLDKINSRAGTGTDPGDDSTTDDTPIDEPILEEGTTGGDEPTEDSNNNDAIEEPVENDDKTTNDEPAQEDSKNTGTGGGSSGTDSGGDSTENGDTPSEPGSALDDPAIETLWENYGWLQFDGGEQSMLNPGFSLTEISSGSFTFEAMVQYMGAESRTWSPIFGSSSATSGGGQILNIGKASGTFDLHIRLGDLAHLEIASPKLFDGIERHLAVAFDHDAQEIRVYVDRVLIHPPTSVAGALTSTTSDLLLGAVGHSSSERWKGWIGPTRVSSVALESSQLLGSAGEPVDPRPNKAPTISGTPETALVVGTPWSFTPNASDPDGDTLTFTIRNQPSWAEFDPETGRLWGIPHESGRYGEITITVEDTHEATASLDPFTLQVDEPTLGTATVSWEAPTSRTDGSALPSSELAGYRVYWGTDPNNLERMDEINNQGVLSLHIANLEKGTWHFAVTALCSKGLESPKSEIGSKTIM